MQPEADALPCKEQQDIACRAEDTEECATRSESNADRSDPKDITAALNGRLYLWFETFPATK